VAQIALKAADPARIAGGMVAAQGTSMLLASPKQEEKAPERETALSLGLERFETASFETPVRATAPLSREAGFRKEIEPTDISAIANDLPEQPGFEMISESQEAQPARPVEAASMAESIRTHVQVLKSSSQERLEVVLRPDTNTELHLRIEHVNGRIQIQARCDRGDFAILDANWNTIQSTLAAQGIRVEPLQTSSGAQFHQESSLDSDHQSSRRQERENNFIEQEIADRKVTRQQVAGGSAVRGWQSWA
jgi:flagellar hook-length control protein FliK